MNEWKGAIEKLRGQNEGGGGQKCLFQSTLRVRAVFCFSNPGVFVVIAKQKSGFAPFVNPQMSTPSTPAKYGAEGIKTNCPRRGGGGQTVAKFCPRSC